MVLLMGGLCYSKRQNEIMTKKGRGTTKAQLKVSKFLRVCKLDVDETKSQTKLSALQP